MKTVALGQYRTPVDMSAFKKYVASSEYARHERERAAHVAFFQRELPQGLDDLSESDMTAALSMLGASRIWGNKAYYVRKIIADNGIERLQQALAALYDTTVPVASRYEAFLATIKGLGPASVTEMLCYIDPTKCGIWNRRAREALKLLGANMPFNPDKYRITGTELDGFNRVLGAIAAELQRELSRPVDLLFVDFFLYQVGLASEDEITKTDVSASPAVLDHDEIRDLVQSIGVMLGFDAEVEVKVSHGAKVDAVWRARIGNLGMVTYVFEVHKAGSIDSLLLNLQKAKSSPTIQKVIAVSDEEQLARVQKESTGLPEEFRKSIAFWPVSQVRDVAASLEHASSVISSLGLVQGSF
jgi:hypothetical protein